MRRLFALSIVCAWVLCALCSSAFGETIVFKNGRYISGAIAKIKAEKVYVSLDSEHSNGTMWFNVADIATIDGMSFEAAAAKFKADQLASLLEDEATLKEYVNETVAMVSGLTGMPVRNPIETKLLTREALGELIKKQMSGEPQIKKLAQQKKLLVKLGLVERSFDYEKAVFDFYTNATQGLYEPKAKTLYILEGVKSVEVQGVPNIVVLHEVVHALQDQNYGLEKMIERDSSDATEAVTAVVEGSATLFMFERFFKSLKSLFEQHAQTSTVAQVNFDLSSFVMDMMLAQAKSVRHEDRPVVFMEEILFPYVMGGKFMDYEVKKNGWIHVKEVLADPPLSTEQILHPEKYFMFPDKPVPVQLDITLVPEGYSVVTSDTLGEFSIYLFLKNKLDELSAQSAAGGWGGDRYILCERSDNGALALIIDSRWDSEKDAEEFFSIYKTYLQKRYERIVFDEETPVAFNAHAAKASVCAERVGARVVIADGFTASDTCDAVKKKMLSSPEVVP